MKNPTITGMRLGSVISVFMIAINSQHEGWQITSITNVPCSPEVEQLISK